MDIKLRQRRKSRIRSKLYGTSTRPRACIYRSLRHFAIQIINDDLGQTLAAASSKEVDLKGKNKTQAAQAVGELAAKKAIAAGIKQVVFDRNVFRYHGRVKAAADAMREAGLQF